MKWSIRWRRGCMWGRMVVVGFILGRRRRRNNLFNNLNLYILLYVESEEGTVYRSEVPEVAFDVVTCSNIYNWVSEYRWKGEEYIGLVPPQENKRTPLTLSDGPRCNNIRTYPSDSPSYDLQDVQARLHSSQSSERGQSDNTLLGFAEHRGGV